MNHTVYVVATLVVALANLTSAALDFVRFPQIAVNMAKAGVDDRWIRPLGLPKVCGALGLLAGFTFPWLGVAAGIGLVTFFLLAVGVHLRGHFYDFRILGVYLGLAVVGLIAALSAV